MPTYPHVTLGCFDCKQGGSVPASDSSWPRLRSRRHLAPTQGPYCTASGLSQWASSRVFWNQVGPCCARLVTQWWGPRAGHSTELPLIIWSPSDVTYHTLSDSVWPQQWKNMWLIVDLFAYPSDVTRHTLSDSVWPQQWKNMWLIVDLFVQV